MSDYITDFRQGDTKIIEIDYGTGVDITGWKFWITLRESLESTKIIVQSSTVAGDNVLDDVANGLAYLTITSTDSMTIDAGSYNWDIQVRKGNSDPAVISTILPPIADYKDKINVVPGSTIVIV